MSVLPDPAFWRGKRVFLTGHTGFKGSWLSLWLQSMGAQVKGFSLRPPTNPALFVEAHVADRMESEIGDIRDRAALAASVQNFAPEIVLHLAAQPLVRQSYADPIETLETNILGTAHLIEAVRQTGSVKAVVNVTTDKCYENREWVWGYRENEAMGGHDPYSASKGCAELVSSAYRRSFLNDAGIAIATARAGNVIGGGDWAADRLIPDILRAFENKRPAVIRNPHATRPWQHVLEPLSGYLVLSEYLYKEGADWAEGWNFGPNDQDAKPVSWIVDTMISAWGAGASWEKDQAWSPHEATFLKLDISKARNRLHWAPRWHLSAALDQIVTWHRAWRAGDDMRALCLSQIDNYLASQSTWTNEKD